MRCITGAKFTMTATLLHVDQEYVPPAEGQTEGHWTEYQDMYGDIITKWVPGTGATVDDPGTDVNESLVGDFPCVARGMSTSNKYGSAENFGENYENVDLVRLWVPAHVRIKKSDRVTNIRKGETILWLNDDDEAVTFNVNGVIPQFNGPFNQHNETYVLLERVEV